MEAIVGKTITETMISVPKLEYQVLKEVYKTVRRQQFLVRLDESEKNLNVGKVRKVTADKFIDSI
jgi:hypothetical protein